MMKKEISLSERQKEVTLEAAPEKTVFDALAEQGVALEAGCGGKGRCGRCRVRYLMSAPLPTATERRFFSAQELRNGMRLACLHAVNRACRVEPAYLQPPGIEIVTAGMPSAAGGTPYVDKMSCADSAPAVDNMCSGDWCVAIDLGTTTIAMQARRLRDGVVLGEWKSMNPQRRFGSDVISRMQAARDGHARELEDAVKAVLAAGIEALLQENVGSLKGIYLAGNTVMEHLLAGWPTDGLSRHPFRPYTLEEQQIELALSSKNAEEGRLCANAEAVPVFDAAGKSHEAPAIPGAAGESHMDAGMAENSQTNMVSLTLLPGFSAFVGADLLAGVLACGMHRKEELCLLIDLGTNGEMVLGNRHRLLCTATAAGPAFEGGPGNPAPGTDLIAVTALLLEAGIVDKTGLMAEPWFETGIDWFPSETKARGALEGSASVHITQEQIRAIQMAKAAIYAGICVLTKEYGTSFSGIRQVYLAGGFGYYLNVRKAARIGLFPVELSDRVTAVGNTSLAGAYLYGRNREKETAASLKNRCTAINLAQYPDFQDLYLEHLNF